MLATFLTQADLLAGMRRSTSWIKLTEEAAHRALLPALSHVTITGKPLKRLDELTLSEALDVIRQLADDRERLLDTIVEPLTGNPAQTKRQT